MTTDPRTRSETVALARLKAKAAAQETAAEAVDKALLDARAAGASLRTIAAVLGVSHVAVHQRLRVLDAAAAPMLEEVPS